jgi:hypothetical protein
MSACYRTRTGEACESETWQGFSSIIKQLSAELLNGFCYWSMYLSFHLIASIAFSQDIFFENNDQSSPQPISYEKSVTQFNNISAV